LTENNKQIAATHPETFMNARTVRAVVTAALLFGCALTALAAGPEVVILKDGFVIQGNVHKQVETIVDKATGIPVQVVKTNGMSMINEGAKFTIFSEHAKQLGAIAPDTKLRPTYKGYSMPFAGFKAANPLPAGETIKTSEFNSKWVRHLTVKVIGAAPETIDQQITYMDPYFLYMASATHRWRLSYRTNEFDPRLIRRLLMMHPELAEPDGKCDPIKRIMLGKFMLDAGWLQFAKDEVDRLNRDSAGTMSKEAREQYEKLLQEIDETTAELVVREAELALAAGRYQYTAQLLAVFPEKKASAKDVARAAKVSADLKTGQERYDAARRMLRSTIDDALGMRPVNALTAMGGGLALATWQPAKTLPGQTLDLAAAAEQVYAELHPDSAQRIETFVTLASQAERERAAGKEPTKKPDELLATAVSGWAKGKNGATPNPDSAWKLWSARELVLAYQRAENMNDRTAVIGVYRKNIPLAPDELAQMISLLPPAAPENLLERTGTQVALGKVRETGIYRRSTLPVQGHANGIEYLVKLPPEYHHGRAYPVLIALTHPGLNPEDVLVPLITEADKNGYILLVPEWTNMFSKGGWEWRGEDHVYVTAVLRDAVRHFTVDNDKVFLTGVADGANMAMDVGMSHPDLFAGVIPMGPIPKWTGLFSEYWANAQKLPFYTVSGEQMGEGSKSLRAIYEKWTQRGFPAVWAVYLGRGAEWYASEVPMLFDWMSRKTRVNGTATLALGTYRQPWQMLRETDNRFYWLQADKIVIGKFGGAPVPATIQGDIRGSNFIDIQCRGVKHITIWLSNEMIDWSRPVKVQINGSLPQTWQKAKEVPQSIEVLLEDYYARGDRRMLFLNKLEFDTIR
jgi:hypothetical protein